MNIYLAGGMRTNWQDKVIEAVGFAHRIFDPRKKGAEKSMTLEEYGTWDLTYVKKCDIVFVYMEKTNPSGIGLACEAGFGYGIGKTVITVIEPDNEHQADRYIAFLKKVSHVVFDNLEDGIEYLKAYV
jgi:hypothetical protein